MIANSALTTYEPETVCKLVRSLEIYDNNSLSWVRYLNAQSATYPWITGWTDPVGAGPVYISSINGFTIFTQDFNTFDNENNPPSTFQLRTKVQDYFTTNAQSIIYDYCNVQIKYECDDDVVTLKED